MHTKRERHTHSQGDTHTLRDIHKERHTHTLTVCAKISFPCASYATRVAAPYRKLGVCSSAFAGRINSTRNPNSPNAASFSIGTLITNVIYSGV